MKSLVARMSISSKTGITVDFGHKSSRMHIYGWTRCKTEQVAIVVLKLSSKNCEQFYSGVSDVGIDLQI